MGPVINPAIISTITKKEVSTNSLKKQQRITQAAINIIFDCMWWKLSFINSIINKDIVDK